VPRVFFQGDSSVFTVHPAPPGFPGAAGTLQLWHASGSLHGSLPTRDRDGHPELEVVGEHRTRLL